MRLRFFLGLVATSAVGTALTMGCGGDDTISIAPPDDDASTPDGSYVGNDGTAAMDAADSADAYQCVNLQCQQVSCESGTTTVSGTVYAPNGTLPLYNVIVYVPNKDPDPLPAGAVCDHCGVITSGEPLSVALTDAKGHFQLTNVPVGANIPLVMQVGKWRRTIKIPMVNACVDNAVGQQMAGVEQLTRLPKNQTEGSMPKIAIATGGCNHFACMMPKIGIDSTEYAAGPTSSAVLPTAAVSFYNGSGGAGPPGTPLATPFWNDTKQLLNFDIAVFSCECSEATPLTKTQASYDAVLSYLQAGGRILTTDFQYLWYKDSKDTNLNAPPWSWPGGAPFLSTSYTLDQTFPKGKALADWLYSVSSNPPYNANTTQPPVNGQFPVAVSFGNINAVDPKYGVSWAASTDGKPKFVTMNEPSSMPPAAQCGKAMHADDHVNTADKVDDTFPAGCGTTFKETELAAAFFFFDLASCIQNDTAPVVVPVGGDD